MGLFPSPTTTAHWTQVEFPYYLHSTTEYGILPTILPPPPPLSCPILYFPLTFHQSGEVHNGLVHPVFYSPFLPPLIGLLVPLVPLGLFPLPHHPPSQVRRSTRLQHKFFSLGPQVATREREGGGNKAKCRAKENHSIW